MTIDYSITLVHVGIPTLDGKPHQECVLGLLSAWTLLISGISFVRGPLIGRGRDIITAEFLEGNATHVLYIDSDMDWRRLDLEQLLELEVPFAFGQYVQKSEARKFNHRGSGKVVRLPSGYEAREYDRCGGGFVLCTRACIQEMIVTYEPELGYSDPASGRALAGLWWQAGYTEGPDGERVVETEDYAFCRRWRDLGGSIYTRESVQLGHVGSKVYRG